MAGISGMGSPNQITPVSPELNIQPPEGMQFSAPSDQYVEAPPPQKPSLDEIFGQQAQAERPSLDSIFAEPAPFTTETRSLLGQIEELPARAKAGLQVTDKELQESLEGSFGKENVRMRGKNLEYKTEGKWREFDKGLEVGDLGDLSRLIVEEVPAMGATVLAAIPAIAASVSTGGAATPASIASVAAARSAGAVGGQAIADWMQSLTGVEKDPDRNAALEYGTTAVLAPIAGAVGDFTAKQLFSPKELFKDEITNITESAEFLKSQGLYENIPGTDTPLILSQLNPSNPLAKELTQKAAGLDSFKQAIELQSKSMDNGVMSFIKELGNVTGDLSGSGDKFKTTVESAIKQEGKLIGDARKLLVDSAGNGELPIPKMKENIEAFAKELGFNGNRDSKEVAAYMVDQLGYSDKTAKLIANKVSKLQELVTNKQGRITASELMGAYAEVNGAYRNLIERGMDADTLGKSSLGKLRRFVADEVTNKVEVISGAEAKSAYSKSLSNYKELVEAADEFSSLLKQDKVATHSLSKAIFDKGKSGLDTLNATKVLLKDSPDLMDNVKGQYLQSVRAKTFNSATGKTDWNRFVKEVNGLGPEMLESAFGKDAKEKLGHFAVLGQAIESGNVNFSKAPEKAAFIKKVVLALKSPFVAGNAAVDVISQYDAEKALASAISKDGIESFLTTVPKDQKSTVRSFLDGVRRVALAGSLVSDAAVRSELRGRREQKFEPQK